MVDLTTYYIAAGFFLLIERLICALVAINAAEKKNLGPANGFWWGLCFGFFGVMVEVMRPYNYNFEMTKLAENSDDIKTALNVIRCARETNDEHDYKEINRHIDNAGNVYITYRCRKCEAEKHVVKRPMSYSEEVI